MIFRQVSTLHKLEMHKLELQKKLVWEKQISIKNLFLH